MSVKARPSARMSVTRRGMNGSFLLRWIGEHLPSLARSFEGQRRQEAELLDGVGEVIGHVADLLDDLDLAVPQSLVAARRRGAEGLVVPSASLLGDNLVIFLDRLRPTSLIEVVRSIEPRL